VWTEVEPGEPSNNRKGVGRWIKKKGSAEKGKRGESKRGLKKKQDDASRFIGGWKVGSIKDELGSNQFKNAA